MRIEIESFGETIVKRDLARFGDNLIDWSHAFDQVGAIMRAASEAQFDTEGGHASGKWRELAESTKVKRGDDGHPILQVTGALKDSLTRKFDPSHIEVASRDVLRFGSTVPYGVYHQSTLPRTKIPYRPPVGLTAGDKIAIVKTLQRAAVEGVRG
jgi:phage gpG-like protein